MGDYFEHEPAMLTAVANIGYHFVSWNDGNTENPCTVLVVGDVTYTATFAEGGSQGIVGVVDDEVFVIYLNPACWSVNVKIDGVDDGVRVYVMDISGRVMMSESMMGSGVKRLDVSGLAQGTYFVRVVGERVNGVRKLIVR